MDADTIVEIVLAATAAGAGVDVALTRRRLHKAEARIGILEAALRGTGSGGRLLDGRTRRVAQTAVKAMIGTAERLREGGVSGLLSSSLDDLTSWVRADQQAIKKIASPDGTVTIFFSDIEGSTALNESLGDKAWLRVLKDHEELVRTAIGVENGHVVKNYGDGFMAVFRDPFSAGRASLAIQQKLEEHRRLAKLHIHVRIGLHSGAVLSHDGDYFGKNVAMAARVAAEASGGEVLVSETVRDAYASADTQARLTAVGEFELKGLSGHHTLWRLEV